MKKSIGAREKRRYPELGSGPNRVEGPGNGTVQPDTLLKQIKQVLRARHYSPSTEKTYCHWVLRYIHFHKGRRPAKMGEAEINGFLSHLARAPAGRFRDSEQPVRDQLSAAEADAFGNARAS